MNTSKHWTIFIDNSVDSHRFITKVLEGKYPKEIAYLKDLKGKVLSRVSIDEFIRQEEVHDLKSHYKGYSSIIKIDVEWGTTKKCVEFFVIQ